MRGSSFAINKMHTGGLTTRRRPLCCVFTMSLNMWRWIGGGAALFLTANGLPAQVLTLNDAVSLALEQNLRLRIERLEPENAQDELQAERAAFDLNLNAAVRAGEQSGPDIVTIEGESPEDPPQQVVVTRASASRNYTVGATQRLVTGTTVTAETRLDRFRERDERHDADLALTIRQPLWRGFGPRVNRAGIRAAEAGLDAAKAAYRAEVEQILEDTESTYWQAAYLGERLSLLETSVQVAESLLSEARQREAVGVATRLDVLQAEASLAERRQAVLSATQDVYDVADGLLLLLGTLSAEQAFDTVAAVEELPEIDPQAPSLVTLWQDAIEANPGLQAQAAFIVQRQEQLLVAENETRPELDLVLSGGYTGQDDESRALAFQDAVDREGEFWTAGVELNFPWGLRAQEAQQRIRRRELSAAELQLQQLELDLLRELRQGVRALTISLQRRETALQTLALQEETFARERTRYQNGQATFREVLEAQRDLDDARASLLEARYDIITADLTLSRLSGSLLDRYNLNWEAIR